MSNRFQRASVGGTAVSREIRGRARKMVPNDLVYQLGNGPLLISGDVVERFTDVRIEPYELDIDRHTTPCSAPGPRLNRFPINTARADGYASGRLIR